VQQQIKLAVGPQAVQASAGVMQAALPLVREVQIAFGVKDQIVHTFEALAVATLQERGDSAAGHIQAHQPVLVIRDQQGVGIQKFHAIRFAVVLGHQAHMPCGSMRKMRPQGMSVTYRLPAPSNTGPSRNESVMVPPRLASAQTLGAGRRKTSGMTLNVSSSRTSGAAAET
jgi:hypothetical protein